MGIGSFIQSGTLSNWSGGNSTVFPSPYVRSLFPFFLRPKQIPLITECIGDIKMKATAKVTVHLEISNLGTWGEDFMFSQLHAQAIDTAIHKLEKAVAHSKDFRLIGKPRITAILVNEE